MVKEALVLFKAMQALGKQAWQGRIEGAIQKSRMWFIPAGTEKPIDPRKARKLEQMRS